jgi:hypothetical protein
MNTNQNANTWRPSMQAHDAVKILNRYRHRYHDGWYVAGEGPSEIIYRADNLEWFTPFEGVAIAKAYLAKGEPGAEQ